MKKIIVYTFIITIFSKFLGFGREIALSYYYGVSNISDAYLISLTIPTVVFGFITSSIVAGYVPIFTEILHKHGRKKAIEFTNSLMNITILINSFFVLFSMIFAKEIVFLFASGFDENTIEMAAEFSRITVVSIYFVSLVSIFSGYLQVNNVHNVVAFLGVILNITTISFIILSKANILFLPLGFLVATFFQFTIMYIYSRRKKYKYKLTLDWKNEYLKRIGLLSIPIIIGGSVNQINTLVDRTLASHSSVGGISALNYANTLNLFVQGIFVVTIISVIYPKMSKEASINNFVQYKRYLRKAVILICYLVIPISFIFIFYSNSIISIIFQRGNFDENAVKLTSEILQMYSIGIFAFGIREMLVRAFYSIQNTRTPMVNGVWGMLSNVLFSFTFEFFLGVKGLALGTSLAAIVMVLTLSISLHKKIGDYGVERIYLSLLKLILLSVSAGFLSLGVYNASIFPTITNLIFSIIIFTITYVLLSMMSNIPEISEIRVQLQKIIKLKKGE